MKLFLSLAKTAIKSPSLLNNENYHQIKEKAKTYFFLASEFVITSRIGLKLFARNSFPIDQTKAKRAELKALKIIKKFTKLNRHLNIVEIHNSEEDVIIRF